MGRILPYWLRGSLALFMLCLITAIICTPVLLLALLKFVFPWSWFREPTTRLLNILAATWVDLNRLWIIPFRDSPWHVTVDPNLDPASWYLVVCNHQSWSDIFIVQTILNRRVPQMKFFLKQELIWVPLIGLVWWALDFPFMRRYSRSYLKKHPDKRGKDFATTRKACEKFRNQPVCIFNFIEGTRFTVEKHRKQHSPFQHLLKPRAGGIGYVLSSMGDLLPSLIDITIQYHGNVPGFWDFLTGKTPPAMIKIAVRPIPENLRHGDYSSDAQHRADLQKWLNRVWTEKDEALSELHQAKQ
ncbi:MAG: acyltransferase [Desulfuromonas sp.]|nr:MAG: acyltransferase [Desulfuromonas sp.]